MAIKHRKLFPALTVTNQTDFCRGLCDPACPYNCYPYPDDYDLPPPPPPPPILSGVDHGDRSEHISPYVIIVVCLLASFFLLVSYYVIISKSFFGWFRPRNNNPQQAESDNADEDFLDENQVDNPIWFITSVGLQQSVINLITVCKYKRGEGLIEGTECSVCLNEFQEDETLRLLPKCNHAFHVSCIDTWLRSHTNCPLCRAHIVSGTVTAPSAPRELNSDHLSPTMNTQMENSAINGEFGENQERNGEQVQNRNEAADGEAEILQVPDGRNTKEAINTDGNGVLQVMVDRKNDLQVVDNEMQPIGRSASMDSSRASTIRLGLSNFTPVESEGSSINAEEVAEKSYSGSFTKQESGFRLVGSSSIAECLHRGPVSMKRSFSCGGRFFSSKSNRSLNAILPL